MVTVEDLNAEIDKRTEQLEHLLVDPRHDLKHIADRLLDFAKEFSLDRKHAHRAIFFSRAAKELQQEHRQDSITRNDYEVRWKNLFMGILGLRDEIRDEFRPEAFLPQEPIGSSSAAKPVFRGVGLTKTYRGFRLAGIDLELNTREITGLLGVNGSGKTTLLRIVAGELAVDKGVIAYPALDSGGLDWSAIRDQIAYIPQYPPRWYGKLADNLHLTASEHGLKGETNQIQVNLVLERLGLRRYADYRWDEISGGFRIRFELARALVRRPRLLILDEPLAHLDIVSMQGFLRDLRAFASSETVPLAVLISSQHVDEVEPIVDRLLFFRDGQAVFAGRADDLAGKRNRFELIPANPAVELLSDPPDSIVLNVERLAGSLVIQTPSKVEGKDLLRWLLDNGVAIRAFRDLTRSTRRFLTTEEDTL
ncbi:ATP-binding cassette domain-containing protein [Paludisphaera rhizosphaerae]|uniref:ATP-binding cassette domain-containing protein n=1 Tax=Paludisphaera rhizosphaerae TaxID=2711216 RepID=UPI0013EC44EC|nr:ABC transporter ATP-binding protein [Paludisphaera rhizosphaerae]